ncbi:hypothetical protein KSP39_PZI016988 [Platanthera zijinensis]|uniref:Uncharacterized protein n=1 Tax=Platanthera zijinensis TaxID=2320716 RepID=A0AAP0B6C9_9ASPA
MYIISKIWTSRQWCKSAVDQHLLWTQTEMPSLPISLQLMLRFSLATNLQQLPSGNWHQDKRIRFQDLALIVCR